MTIKEHLLATVLEMQREAIEAHEPVMRRFQTADGWAEIIVQPEPGTPQVSYRDDRGYESSKASIELKRENLN